MTDEDNRFASVAEKLDDAESVDPDADGAKPVDPDADAGTGPGNEDGEAATVPEDPAFPFSEVTQYPFYARRESWEALESALGGDPETALAELGVENLAKRELHDAVLRVAAENPEAVVAAVRDARRDDE